MNAYDIETFNDKDGYIKPYCICYNILNKFYYNYYNKNDNIIKNSVDFLLINNNNGVMYIHNINYDGFIILDYLSTENYKIESLIRENNIYKLTIIKNNLNITFKCSFKILPESLSKIAKNFNLSKKKIFPHKFSNMENLFYVGSAPSSIFFENKEDFINFSKENKKFNFRKISIKYCKRDVYITKKFMEKISIMCSPFNIDLSKIYSAPSLSLKIFINTYNKNRISFNVPEYVDKIVRKSYFGGRCEIYGNPLDSEFIHYYDFSGMYAQCMKEKFPYGKIFIKDTNISITDIGFHHIQYYSNINHPVLPHKSKIDNKLLFCNGSGSGIFWWEEIQLFENMGGVVNKINFSILFEKYDNIFEDFVDYFTKIRNIDDTHKKFGKLIINSLYGRMGMNDIETECKIIKQSEFINFISKKKIKSFKQLNDIVLVEYMSNNVKKVKKNIFIASSITSKARIKLYKAHMDVINNGGRLLYSDTDSVFAAYDKDVSDQTHGIIDWKKENIKIKEAIFILPKTYAIKHQNGKEEIKIKGFENKNNDITYDIIKRKFETETKLYTKSFDLIKKNLRIKYEKKIKILNLSNYNKRLFINNKKNTIPYKINMEEDSFKYFS